jgi:hypothetical protein
MATNHGIVRPSGQVENRPDPGQDIWWEQKTSVKRQLTPINGCRVSLLGMVNYASVTPEFLQGLPCASAPITGSNNSANQLNNGAAFAVRATEGNYAKVQGAQYGYDMNLRWTL